MNEEEPSFTLREFLIRKCVALLDNVYSTHDCVQFMKPLYDMETKLFNDLYTDQTSFFVDLSKIYLLPPDYIDQLKKLSSPSKPVVEEYSQLPIYSSIHLRPDSLLYTMNIEPTSFMHYSIYESLKTAESKPPIYRLFVKRKTNLLMEAKESISGILAVFLNAQVEPFEGNTELYRLKAQVLIVHPLGDLYTTASPFVEGWIKVKLIKDKNIDTIISSRMAEKIFFGESEVVRKLPLKPNTKLKYAKENEIRQHFLHTIMSFNYSKFEYCHTIPADKISTKNSVIIKDHTPMHVSTDVFTTSIPIPGSTSNKRSSKQDQPVAGSHWKKLEEFSREKSCSITLERDYRERLSQCVDAHGYFKRVFFNENDVIQIFQKSTSSQRVTEIVCLLKLRDEQYIGHINQLIFDDTMTEAVGLTMERYEMTLKDYLKTNKYRHLSSYQRMDVVIQMLRSIKIIHENGIAHRDLSTVNFMVSVSKDKPPLDDGSPKIDLFLIDFGKSIFFRPEEARRWWVCSNEQDIYKDETKPQTKEELTIWCKNLPMVMARPDHGYIFYRSIQTLPKSVKDHNLLNYLVNPYQEDLYSVGTLIWKIFSGKEPWPGVFDTEYKELREAVSTDYNIDHIIDREVSGEMSKALLKKFVRADPDQRRSAAEVLDWIVQPHVVEGLINEWNALDSNKHIPYYENRRNKSSTARSTTANNENVPKRNYKGRPKGTLNKKTILKMRMGEVGKTNTSDKEETDELDEDDDDNPLLKDHEVDRKSPKARENGEKKERE